MSANRLPHLVVEGSFKTENFTTPKGGGNDDQPLPIRERKSHGNSIKSQLDKIRVQNDKNRGIVTTIDEPAPISIEVRSEPGYTLKLDSLEYKPKAIEVACVRTEDDIQIATVQVPEGALTHFYNVTEKYLNEMTKGTVKTLPKPKNQDFIDRISEINLATLRSFWTDESEFPDLSRKIWWEVWIRKLGGQNHWDRFREKVASIGLDLNFGTDSIEFPDRIVGLVFGTPEQLMSSPELLDMIGELRRAKENPAEFIEMNPCEQADWVNNFLPRIEPPPADAPAVCLLDGGVISNPLIALAFSSADSYCYDTSWRNVDLPEPSSHRCHTHGTEMAGCILFGSELADYIPSHFSYRLRHRLESARILPPWPANNEPRLYGAITSQTISRVEIARPQRNRNFCMAVTTSGIDRGKPSSWSGMIDQICSGALDENPRLFFISAGNTDPNQRHRYPESNDTDSIQDPAQAWNAITVGACTDRVIFDQSEFPGYEPLASAGDLSPCSTTSLQWESKWPYKPDIVLEGGNQIIVKGTNKVMDPDQMGLLTTAHATSGTLLVNFRDTSAATAQAARMGAILQAHYPKLWPETVRALLIHSAEWTEPMWQAFGKRKRDHVTRLRRYGYGIPSLERALYSAKDSLTLLVQQKIQPFTKKGSESKTKDMGIHELPWPKKQLSDLGDQNVTMRVTLSYFIEPKPSRREGFVKHQYHSHGLRFEVKRPTETVEQFRRRVNKVARGKTEKFKSGSKTAGWTLGPKNRDRGSIHSDWWTGTAADLANCGLIAVYPDNGWWRQSKGDDWAKQARYALVVSIRTNPVSVSTSTPTEVDLYTPVEILIKSATKTTTTIETDDSE